MAVAVSGGCASSSGGAAEGVLAVAAPAAGGDRAVVDWPAPADVSGEEATAPPESGKGFHRAPRITIADAVEEALAYNRTVKQAELFERIGVTFEKEARSALIPQLNGDVGYQWVAEVPTIANPGLPSIQVGPEQQWSGGLTMSFPVFAFGRHINNYRAAVLSRQQAEADADATESDIAAAVTASAFDVLEAQANVDVALDNEKALWQQVEDARARYEAETVTKEAVLEAEVQHAQAKRLRERLQSSIPILVMRLNLSLGRPAHAATEVVDDPDTREPIWKQESLEQEALTRRAELRSAELEVAAAERTVKATIGGELGELRGNLRWDATDNSFQSPQEQLTLFLGLQLPIFTGGARSARIRRSRYELDISRLQLRDLQTRIRTEVADAYRQVVEAFRDIGVADKSRAQATESLRIQQEKFRNGRATSQEVLISTSLLTNTRADYVNAVYTYNVALRGLHRARGADPRLSPFYELKSKGVPTDEGADQEQDADQEKDAN
ncbi:MAG: TolC family protein [Planctomycetota bacterium]